MKQNKFYSFRIIFVFIACIIPMLADAQTYYVSPSGNDAANGKSQTTAWASIERVNKALREMDGDTVLFESGGTYLGTIQVDEVEDSKRDPITFSAYGTGQAPVISGAQRVTQWEAINDTLWVAQVSGHPGSIDVLFINGKKHYPARFPNKGYLKVTERQNNGLKDKNLNFPNGYWNGATIAFKPVLYSISRDIVSNSYSNGRIDMVTTRDADTPEAGWGYFFQNHINALDAIGEWVYDKKKSSVFLCTHDNPNTQVIEFINADYGIKIRNSGRQPPYKDCRIVVENLCFQHYRRYAFYGGFGQHMTIRNNVFRNCMSAICISDFHNLDIHDNMIEDMEISGFEFWGGVDYSRIHHNTFRRICTSLDGAQNGHSGVGITVGYALEDNEIYNNRFDSIGSCAINAANMQNLTIKNNVISNTMLSMADAGAIYVVKPAEQKNNKIIGNIIYNTIGNNDGTPWEGKDENIWRHGIYLDDGIEGVTVQGNTVYNSGGGIFLHGASYIHAHGNVLYNNEIANVVIQDADQGQLSHNNIERNYMHKDIGLMYFIGMDSGIESFSTVNKIDYNYISGPTEEYFAIIPGHEVDRKTWLSSTDFDLNSTSEPVSYSTLGVPYNEFTILAYNPTDKVMDFEFDGTYMTFDGTVHRSSVNLQPFGSAILFKTEYDITTDWAEDLLRIYPNPVRKGQTLRLEAKKSTEMEVEVYDLQGRLFGRQQNTGVIMSVSMPEKSGIYLVKAMSSDFQKIFKIIVTE